MRPRMAIWFSILLCTDPFFGDWYFAYAQEEAELKAQFLAEAPKAWEEYRHFAKRLQGTIVTTADKVNPKRSGPTHQQERQLVKQNDQCVLYTFESSTDGKPEGAGSLRNPKYGAEIKRGKENPDWFISRLDMTGKCGSFRNPPAQRVEDLATILLHVYFRALPELLREPNFKITRLSQGARDGQEVIAIDFVYPHTNDQGKFYPIQSGSLILDPHHRWCIREQKTKCQWINSAGTMESKFEIKDGTAGNPIPVRGVLRDRMEDGHGMDIVRDFDFHEATDLPPDREFTLSAFGLPEPSGVEWDSGSRLYLWILAAAAGAALLALVFRQLARRAALAKG